MRTITPEELKTFIPAKNESIVSTCDNCGLYKVIDKEKDLISFEKSNGYEWRIYKCVCGEVFHIRD
jgi:hypothetical protein